MAKITAVTSERLALLHHGTKPVGLSAGAILQVAQADMGRKRKPCFLKKHVAKAKKPSDILKEAVAHHQDGFGSSNVNTARVYSDLDALKAALQKALDNGL